VRGKGGGGTKSVSNPFWGAAKKKKRRKRKDLVFLLSRSKRRGEKKEGGVRSPTKKEKGWVRWGRGGPTIFGQRKKASKKGVKKREYYQTQREGDRPKAQDWETYQRSLSPSAGKFFPRETTVPLELGR